MFLESLVKVTPRQIVFVQKVNHDEKTALDVISPALVVTAARVQTGEQEVARELLDILLCNMLALLVQKLLG